VRKRRALEGVSAGRDEGGGSEREGETHAVPIMLMPRRRLRHDEGGGSANGAASGFKEDKERNGLVADLDGAAKGRVRQ